MQQRSELDELRQQVEGAFAQTANGASPDAVAKLLSGEGLQPGVDVEVMRVEVIRTKTSQAKNPKEITIEEGSTPSGWLCCRAVDSDACKQRSESISISDCKAGSGGSQEVWVGPIGKAQRTAATMALGGTIHYRVKKMEKDVENEKDLDEDELQERWNVVHRQNAKDTFEFIMKYRGFFIKIGQKISTAAGVLPEPWIEELEPLQDDTPTSPMYAVEASVLENLGKPLSKIFCEFEEKPLASASIGQAHAAFLMRNGAKLKVCVKVQHPGVFELASTDLNNLEILVKLMIKFHAEAPDITEIVKDMKENLINEVDFNFEAENARIAFVAFAEKGMDVGCPEPLPELCGKQVLTMRFIEGWKITETEKLPPGTDREALAAQIVEAWSMLVFEYGLIHGDPHPGNIFVEKVDGDRVRPVLLDWGMAKRVTSEQRILLAKWVVAALSQDRFMYLAVLQEMGVEITEAADTEAIDLFMFLAILGLRDTVPSTSFRQFHDQMQTQSKEDKENKKKKREKEGKKAVKMVGKVPGWNRLMGRGIELLQSVCGMLDIMLPIARILLRYAMPLLGISSGPSKPMALPGIAISSLELAVKTKLEQLCAGASIGAQVAVFTGRLKNGTWQCNLASGRAGLTEASISQNSLMPLLDIGVGVLVMSFLMAISHKTATGKEITLDTPVERLWPEFCRGGKGAITIRELLLHQAGLQKPFKSDATYKSICSEVQMEKSVAAAPLDASGNSDVCRVLGIAVAALLRRATGHKTAGEALKSLLAPLDLHEDIVYHDADCRMVHASRKILQEVTMVTLWEALERHKKKLERGDTKFPPWLSWGELGVHQIWCTDALLINCKELREGTGCMVGRGLRATAKSICLLYASEAVAPELLAQCSTVQRQLRVESLEEWRGLCGCIDIGVGFQVFKFKRLDSGEEVFGHGYADASTGSITIRVLGVSVAILLTCVDKDTQHVGYEVLCVIAKHLGLEPVWQSNKPDLQETVGHDIIDNTSKKNNDVQESIARLEAQIARLTQAISSQGSLQSPSSELCGVWNSAEAHGMDAIFDLMQVPTAARTMASRMKTKLDISIFGSNVNITNSMTLMGRQVHETQVSFTVGEPFEGDGFKGTKFQGLAKWVGNNVGEQSRRGFAIDKRMKVLENDICLEECYELTEEGRLSLQFTIKGKGKVNVSLNTEVDKDMLLRSLDRTSLHLTKETRIGARSLLRGGSLHCPSNLAELTSMNIPSQVILNYDDIICTMFFDCQSGAKVGANTQQNHQAASYMHSGPSRVAPVPSLCCGNFRRMLASVFYAIGRACEGGSHPPSSRSFANCKSIVQASPEARGLTPNGGNLVSHDIEEIALNKEFLSDSQDCIRRQISESIDFQRKLSGLSTEELEQSARAPSLVQ